MRPASAIVVIQGSEHGVLGVSRPFDAHDFGFPGGTVEPGETPEQAAVREVKEETGLDVRVRLLEAVPHHERIVHVFLATDVSGELRSSDEGVVAWVTWEHLERGTYGEFNRGLVLLTTLVRDRSAVFERPA